MLTAKELAQKAKRITVDQRRVDKELELIDKKLRGEELIARDGTIEWNIKYFFSRSLNVEEKYAVARELQKYGYSAQVEIFRVRLGYLSGLKITVRNEYD